MDAPLADCIARLHQSPSHWALVLTGGGIRLGGWLLSVPGGSRTVLEVQTPYDTPATDAYLARPPESYCSTETAILLATRARERARWLSPRAEVVGLGCTASLRSEQPKRGDHRVHIATATDAGVHTFTLTLTKDARSRDDEDDIAARLGLLALATAVGQSAPELPLLAGETIERGEVPASGGLARFLRGEVPTLCVLPDGREVASATPPRALVPGSFNPLHEAHLALVSLASQLAGGPVAFELSVKNVEKPSLLAGEVRWRAAQFRWRCPLWVTQAPTIVEKARLFPGVLFAVGADTAVRLIEPRFYGDDPQRMSDAFAEMRRLGCRFLVAGRVDASGVFRGLADLGIPAEHADLFTAIPESVLRLDISSTQLRGT
jgi:hypothetical protein